MANLVLVVGDTGTGKSRSMKSLNPKETFLINCANKPLPFKDSGKLYSEELGNLLTITEDSKPIKAGNVKQSVAKIITDKLKVVIANPTFKNIVIDDSGFIMTDYFFEKATEQGYTKFTVLAQQYQSVLTVCKSAPQNLNIAIMLHDENVTSNSIVTERKAKTVGKLVDDQYNPLSVVSVALFTTVNFDKEGKPVYQFITNRCKDKGVLIPAKSPEGMFDSLQIPNDLGLVFKNSREFYNLS